MQENAYNTRRICVGRGKDTNIISKTEYCSFTYIDTVSKKHTDMQKGEIQHMQGMTCW